MSAGVATLVLADDGHGNVTAHVFAACAENDPLDIAMRAALNGLATAEPPDGYQEADVIAEPVVADLTVGSEERNGASGEHA